MKKPITVIGLLLLLTQTSQAQTFHRDEVGRITAEEYEDFTINYEYNTGGGLIRKWTSPEVGGRPFPVLGDTLRATIDQGEEFVFVGNPYSIQGIYQDTIPGSLEVDTVKWLNLIVCRPSGGISFDPDNYQENLIALDSKEGVRYQLGSYTNKYQYHEGVHYFLWSQYRCNEGDGNVKLSSSEDGINWETEDIISTSNGVQEMTFAFDEQGFMHIAYNEVAVCGTYNYQTTQLVYASNQSGDWETQMIIQGSNYTLYHPHILYWDDHGLLNLIYDKNGWYRYSSPVYQRTLQNGSWSSPVTVSNMIFASNNADNDTNQYTGFEQDTNGEPIFHISSGFYIDRWRSPHQHNNTIQFVKRNEDGAYEFINTLENTRLYQKQLGQEVWVTSYSKEEAKADSLFHNGDLLDVLTEPDRFFRFLSISPDGSFVVANSYNKETELNICHIYNPNDGSSMQLDSLEGFPGQGVVFLANNNSTQALLSVLPLSQLPQRAQACESYTWSVTEETYTASGEYESISYDENGCELRQILELTILEPTQSLTTIDTCATSYTWNSETYTQSGEYEALLTNVAGCDSIATLDLTLKEPTELEPDTVRTCAESYTWYEQEYRSSGDYTFEIENDEGCKSIATLHLNLNLVIGEITTIDTCATAINYHGNNLNESKYHEITITSSGGCDSLARFNLNLNQGEKIAIEGYDALLIAPDNSEYTYVWKDCESGEVVPNETEFRFSPKVPGDYYVEVSDQFCTYKSDCATISVVLSADTEPSKALYPNPTNGNVTLSQTNAQQVKRVEAVDVSGKVIPIEFEILSVNELVLETQHLSKGVYLIRVDQGTEQYKLIKE